jgi:uncharacterized membrane protein
MSGVTWSARGARWILLASLCANVALAAYIGVQWSQPADLPGVALPGRMVERLAARLPEPDAAALRQIYRDKQPELQPLQADYLRALLNTMRLARQPELDKEALRAAVRESRDKRVKIGDAMIESFIDALERISPEGRKQLLRGNLRDQQLLRE